jgi:hypothetical protein
LYFAFKFTSEYGNNCYLDLAKFSAIVDTICAGNAATYSTEPGMTGYTWSVSPGGTITAGSGTNTVSVLWNTSGAQTVSVTYANISGCTAVSPTVSNITVNGSVPTITGSSSVCKGTTGVAYSTEPGMTGYTWNVSSGGTITAGSGTDSITVTWNAAGAQTVSINYTSSGGCTAASPTMLSVSVNANTTPVITQSLDTLYSSVPTGNQWYSVSTGLIPGATGQWYVPTANGTYYDIAILGSCTSDTSNLLVVINTSVKNYSDKNSIMVYPNPAGDFFYIEQPTTGEASIKLFDASGKLIYSSIIRDKKSKIDIDNLVVGIYSLQYNNNSTISVVKIVKMK